VASFGKVIKKYCSKTFAEATNLEKENLSPQRPKARALSLIGVLPMQPQKAGREGRGKHDFVL
jgi:hypothetical protein